MTTAYDYRTPSGELVARKVRTELENGRKTFTWEHPSADGLAWEPGRGRDAADMPLYRAPEIAKAVSNGGWIILTEGEKDADRLASLGFAATTAPDGAGKGKWQDAYSEFLAGANVYVIADADDIGVDYATEIYRSLLSYCRAVKVFLPATDAEHSDVSDHLDAGYSLDQLRDITPEREGEIHRTPPAWPELPGPIGDFVRWARRGTTPTNGLHPQATGPMAMSAIATTTGHARVRYSQMDEPVCTWTLITGPASSGKSPALKQAYALVSERQKRDRAEWHEACEQAEALGQRKPRSTPRLFVDDVTVERLKTLMGYQDGKLSIVSDEFASVLAGLGAYKGGAGDVKDKADLRKMWTGAYVDTQRQGGNDGPKDVTILEPALTMAGADVHADLHMLGDVRTGDRARWLISNVPCEVPALAAHSPGQPSSWVTMMTHLLAVRGTRRVWEVIGDGAQVLQQADQRWTLERGQRPEASAQFLAKGVAHALRLAGVLAESMRPGHGGEIPAEIVGAAVALVDYYVASVESLPAQRPVTVTRTEDKAVWTLTDRLSEWLTRRGGEATRREIQRAEIGGMRKREDVDLMIDRYLDRFGADRKLVRYPEGGGRPSTVILAPAVAA